MLVLTQWIYILPSYSKIIGRGSWVDHLRPYLTAQNTSSLEVMGTYYAGGAEGVQQRREIKL